MRNIKDTIKKHFERHGVEIAGALLALSGNTSAAASYVENR